MSPEPIEVDQDLVVERDDYLETLGESVKLVIEVLPDGTESGIREVQIRGVKFVPEKEAFKTSGWSFRQVEVDIHLNNAVLGKFLQRTRELGYRIVRKNQDDVVNEGSIADSFVVQKGDNYLVIERREVGGAITRVKDDDHGENSPSELAIKMAQSFGGTIKGILVAHNNYQDLGMYPVAIVNGKMIDITQFRIGLVRKQ